ncbi:MAG: aminopeptidase P family protein [Lachnospiraceae bacterium]|nr:aminopeptidase P family protein [Lachnospiraceae bacterium]
MYRDRIEKLRNEMKVRGLDIALVFTSDEHGSEYIDDHYAFRKYLSGFTGSAGSLLITMDEAGLWTDGRYFIQAGRELEGSGIDLHKMGEKDVKDIMDYAGDLMEARKDSGGTKLGVDLRLLGTESYDRLKKICDGHGCIIEDTDLAEAVWEDRPPMNHKAIYVLDDETAGRPVSDKLSDIRARLKKKGADALLISDLSDVMWTFNVRGADILYNPVAVSYGYVDMESARFYAYDESLDDAVREGLKACGVNVCAYGDFDRDMSELKGKKITCDRMTLNAHVYGLLEENKVIDRRSYEYIEKHIKNERECELARKWHIEDGLALTRFIYRIKKLLREGTSAGLSINEYEAAMMLDGMRMKIPGNRGLSFDTISAYGVNGAVIHYSPAESGSALLKPEGFLLVDSGGQYEGATTDVTRTIALGPLSDEMKEDYTSVLKGMLDLADAVFLEGTSGENLDILARRPIWERLVDYRHGTGHGVGAMLNVHEGPQAFRCKIVKGRIQPPLKPGMITSDEPGIYLEGRYGIRIENLLLCREKAVNEWGRFLAFETLTLVPYERDAIVKAMLTDRQRDMINDYNMQIFDLYKDRLTKEERAWLEKETAPL